MKQLSLLTFDRLRRPQPADVAALADEIIEELALTPPIDANIVASYLDIASIEQAEIDVAGCLICGENDVTIKVRNSDGPHRQRFTIFHECSHTFFKGFELEPRYRCAPSMVPGQDDELEALCDEGASALLLPQRFVTADLSAADFGIPTLIDVAEKYEASLEAVGHRIVDFAPDPTLFLVLEERTKPSEHNRPDAEPKLRVRTARGAGGWPYIPTHKSVDEDSVFDRAASGEVVDETVTLAGICRDEVEGVHVSARLTPYRGTRRVLALLRRNKP